MHWGARLLARENRKDHHLIEGDEEMTRLNALYDEDFVRWTEEQAAALRRAKSLRPAGSRGSNLPLDWENLAEEIESLGSWTGASCVRRLPGFCAIS